MIVQLEPYLIINPRDKAVLCSGCICAVSSMPSQFTLIIHPNEKTQTVLTVSYSASRLPCCCSRNWVSNLCASLVFRLFGFIRKRLDIMIATKLILFASAIMAFALERGTAIELHYPIRHPLAHPDEATRVMSTKQKRIAMDGLRMRRKLENGDVSSSIV
jgi:hypothetical protein